MDPSRPVAVIRNANRTRRCTSSSSALKLCGANSEIATLPASCSKKRVTPDSVQLGEHQVEDDQPGRLGFDLGQGGAPIGSGGDRKPSRSRFTRTEEDNLWVVVDYQDRRVHHNLEHRIARLLLNCEWHDA